jgi:hypothetical protein
VGQGNSPVPLPRYRADVSTLLLSLLNAGYLGSSFGPSMADELLGPPNAVKRLRPK